jgi:hypothetical protein
MLYLVKIDSFSFDSFKKRIMKFLRLSKKDVQTAVEVGPYGFDSGAIKGMVAVYSKTIVDGKTVILGYWNKEQLAGIGELRLYGTNANGDLKCWTWLKNDGTYEVLGNGDNMVRYKPLDDSLQSFKNAISVELGKIATGIAGAGGSYTPGALSIDTSDAKIDRIKTIDKNNQ